MAGNLIGKVILNQYRIDAFIASGGMGAVYRVWDLQRNVPLAMKILHEDFLDDPTILKSFKREGRALEKLAHPNIVPFYGIGESGETICLFSRFIDGPPLKTILKKQEGKPLSISESLIYLKAVSAALGYAHRNGVVHCDVKPGNVMVDQGGSVYLTDFGIARHAESTKTSFGGAVGTAYYMSPEQFMEREVTPATDVYALAVMLFEMLTGRRPFIGDEIPVSDSATTKRSLLMHAHLRVPPPMASDFNSEVPLAVSNVIRKAMAKDPRERYKSTQEFYAEICEAAGSALDDIPGRVKAQSEYPSSVPVQETSYPGGKKSFGLSSISSGIWVALGIGAIAVLAILFIGSRLLSASRSQASELMNNTQDSMGVVSVLEEETQQPNQTTPTSNPVGENQQDEIIFTQAAHTLEVGLTQTADAQQRATIEAQLSSTASPTRLPTETPIQIPEPIDIRVNPVDGAEYVIVPEGEFRMGSDPGADSLFWGAEGPSHPVYLDTFWIYRLEVTNGMYQACVEEQACPRPMQIHSIIADEYYGNFTYDDYPVIYVTYTGALSYCRWAGGKHPTEAQWEKAARGTDARLFPWGDQPPTDELANVCGSDCATGTDRESFPDGYPGPAPVGQFPAGASPYGLLDMAGNVWEWTSDYFDPLYYSSAPYDNPIGPANGTTRTLRGGSWYNPRSGIRTVARISLKPDDSLNSLGFRCVMPSP